MSVTSNHSKVLVTGCAGFIGYHLTKYLIQLGFCVVGIDNINDYYSQDLKNDRLNDLKTSDFSSLFSFYKVDIREIDALSDIFVKEAPQYVVHLAAQAGVRWSLTNPHEYISNNIEGFLNILELCRHQNIEHLLYASSSSVYGGNTHYPSRVEDDVSRPLSLYATSKRANELMAYNYSHLFGLRTTGLRFFTVYGPWGRPDMALFKFVRGIMRDEPIDVYNNGNMERDFTYVDDIVSIIQKLIIVDYEALPQSRIHNIGKGKPDRLLNYINEIERILGKKAILNMLPMQPGDTLKSFSDTSDLAFLQIDTPQTTIGVGIQRFVSWYLAYYGDMS